jgi:hypothetical protein
MASGINNGISNRPEIQTTVRNAVSSIFNPVAARLKALRPGANKQDKQSANVQTSTSETPSLDLDKDWRVRVSIPANSSIWNFDSNYENTARGNSKYANVLAPLKGTNGVVFPYTPSIQISHSANYSPLSPTHSNYQSYFYNNSQVSSISVTADFTAQTEEQAKYVLAMIYFFRAATKMFYGQSNNQGSPPPVLYLDGYGDYYFPHVPVVVASFTHTMPSDVDYISCDLSSTETETVKINVEPQSPIEAAYYASVAKSSGQNLREKTITRERFVFGSKQRVPTMSSITVELTPMYSRRNVSENFSWEKFARGELLNNRGGFL